MSILSRFFSSPTDPPPAPAADEPKPAPVAAGPDPAALAREDEARLAAALAGGTPEALTDCVLHAHSTKARQRAAHAVSDPDHLRELIRLVRGGKDNSVYRILTDKRDALLAADRARDARLGAIEVLAASLARRSRLPYDPLYESSLHLFDQEWAVLAPEASPAVSAQVAEHLATMRAVIERHRQDIEAQADRERALAEAAAAAEADARLEHEQGQGTIAEPEPEPEPEPSAEIAPPESQSAAGTPEPRAVSAQPLISLLRQAQAALARGGTARAQRLRVALAAKLAQPVALPGWFDHQLQLLDAKLTELKDWKTFTVEPKRTELVARMQSLIGAEMSPEQLAHHIHRLQEEWRTLNRGAGDEASAEAASFRDAAKRAYEPCKEHFARQSALRQSNRESREAIIVRLQAYAATLDGDAVNWRQVAQTIAEARQEWREFAPVDNAVAPVLQERLRGALGVLQERLDAEYARNVAAKRDLIERAQRLMTLADTRQAIDGAKNLQQQWRQIGLVPRAQSNALWDEFHGHCDAVFQRSAHEHAAAGAALVANQARAQALCDEVERIAALTGEELRVAMRALDERRAEFDGLELPRQAARDLRQRFARATSRCADAVQRERAVAARRATAALFDAAGAIRAFGLARSRSENVESAHAAATAAVAALADAPKAARAVLEKQLTRIAAGDAADDLAANESQLRLLCIRAELVADVATPESDMDLRRDYQMRRLLGAKGLGSDAALADLDSLMREWFTVGPVEPSVEAPLRARFERCREGSRA
ncbi:MAG: DUF349 domain-containing protein [Gammaproteobacteria bacterium]|nr:DUF349 domain-containing protein [Gammaproteobacteria bacterium]